MRIDPAYTQEVVEAYREHGRVASETEPGLVRFDVHQDGEDQNRLFLYEAYADDEAHRVHVEGESHKRARGLVDQLIAQGKAERVGVNLSPVFTHAGGR